VQPHRSKRILGFVRQRTSSTYLTVLQKVSTWKNRTTLSIPYLLLELYRTHNTSTAILYPSSTIATQQHLKIPSYYKQSKKATMSSTPPKPQPQPQFPLLNFLLTPAQQTGLFDAYLAGINAESEKRLQFLDAEHQQRMDDTKRTHESAIEHSKQAHEAKMDLC
jgi:hypothetical protein